MMETRMYKNEKTIMSMFSGLGPAADHYRPTLATVQYASPLLINPEIGAVNCNNLFISR